MLFRYSLSLQRISFAFLSTKTDLYVEADKQHRVSPKRDVTLSPQTNKTWEKRIARWYQTVLDLYQGQVPGLMSTGELMLHYHTFSQSTYRDNRLLAHTHCKRLAHSASQTQTCPLVSEYHSSKISKLCMAGELCCTTTIRWGRQSQRLPQKVILKNAREWGHGRETQ